MMAAGSRRSTRRAASQTAARSRRSPRRRSARSQARSTASTELVIGLVGALGTRLLDVEGELRTVLNDRFGYQSYPISLSGLLKSLRWDRDLDPDHEDERIWNRMDAGRDLNLAWHSQWQAYDSVARLALLAIADARQEESGDPLVPLDRSAFILRSLKRPDEVAFLRAVYGDRFVLIGAYAPRPEREHEIREWMKTSYGSEDESKWKHSLKAMVERDEREEGEAGQNVRGTFHRADFFVSDRADRLGRELERCLDALFGSPFITPTKAEEGMAHAAVAGGRSAEPGRQVGAAITDSAGNLLAVGCNEVPKAFGGQYWSDDKAVVEDPDNDGREFAFAARNNRGIDTNDTRQREIADSIIEALGKKIAVKTAAQRAAVRSRILSSKFGDITEYGRAVHAEMDAITTAARLGTPLQGGILYTTTFPCHNCARHVIATGIKRLVYIAPYAKSQARGLHPDSLAVAPSGNVTDKVVFEPFVGIAPRRYQHLFDAPERKKDGRLVKFDGMMGTPRIPDADSSILTLERLSYITREEWANLQLSKYVRKTKTDPKLINP
jgi:deoxycytidylate deaminase